MNYYGHLKANCYHIFGFLDKKRNPNKAKDGDSSTKKIKVEQDNIASYLTDEDCKLLKDFIHKLGKHFAFSTILFNDDWICDSSDSSASQNMSSNLDLFYDLYNHIT